jgi:hypothetical protein
MSKRVCYGQHGALTLALCIRDIHTTFPQHYVPLLNERDNVWPPQPTAESYEKSAQTDDTLLEPLVHAEVEKRTQACICSEAKLWPIGPCGDERV